MKRLNCEAVRAKFYNNKLTPNGVQQFVQENLERGTNESIRK